MIKGLKILLFIPLLVIIFSCNDEQLISSKKMQDILVDMSVAQAILSNKNESDSVRMRTYSAICEKHHVSMSQWNNSIELYSGKYLSTYKIIYQNAMDSVSKIYSRLQKRQVEIDSLNNIVYRIKSGDIDSVNILNKENIYFDNYYYKVYDKKLYSPYNDKYSLLLSCVASGIYSLDTTAMMKIQMFYTDSTDTTYTKPILKNGINDISVNIPAEKNVNRVVSSLCLLRRFDSFYISDLQLFRYHTSYNE